MTLRAIQAAPETLLHEKDRSCLARFLASLAREDLSPATLRGYGYDLRHFLGWHQGLQEGPFEPGRLAEYDLIAYRRQMMPLVAARRQTFVSRRVTCALHRRSWMSASLKAGTKERSIMPIRTLAEAISHYGHDAYLLTVAQDGPHTSCVTIELRGGSIGCAVGASAARNIARQPNVSLFWPPTEPGGYALIVNGAAAGERWATGVTMAEITLTKSVLHRPSLMPDDSDAPCANDCRRLTR